MLEARLQGEEDGDMDDEGAPKLNVPHLKETKSSHLTRLARTTKLSRMMLPIIMSFRGAQVLFIFQTMRATAVSASLLLALFGSTCACK